MRDNFTSIVILLDQSGSMISLQDNVIKGFNDFISKQKNMPAETALTLCAFSTTNVVVFDWEKLENVPCLDPYSYSPMGGTALFDSMGATIDKIGRKLYEMPERERPSKIVFVVITDGKDTCSSFYSEDKVRNMVRHQRSEYSWDFIFYGANEEAISAANSLGLRGIQYSPEPVGVYNMYSDLFKSINGYSVHRSH